MAALEAARGREGLARAEAGLSARAASAVVVRDREARVKAGEEATATEAARAAAALEVVERAPAAQGSAAEGAGWVEVTVVGAEGLEARRAGYGGRA